MWRNIKLCWN